jgi:SAM-dependent methyltransferase
VTDPPESTRDPSGDGLSAEELARRSGSFGAAASLYERFRPGPPADAIDWILPTRPTAVVDLGAGTGALTKLLVERADTVFAVEPDERMLAVLTKNLPGVRAVVGQGEAIPLPDSSADAVVASSSWHWMDPDRTLAEVARVLTPGGTLGAVWSGPDREGPFLQQAEALLSSGSGSAREPDAPESESDIDMADTILGRGTPDPILAIPSDSPFGQPDYQIFIWNVPLNADDLIGLLGTFSWIILMPEAQREKAFAEARRVLKEGLGVEGDVTVDVQYRADAWRTRLTQ